MVRLLAAERLMQRVPGIADHSIRRAQPLDARIHRTARFEIADPRRLRLVLADQPLDRNAGSNPPGCLRSQPDGLGGGVDPRGGGKPQRKDLAFDDR
jgi:hypothetical protein